MLFLQAVSASHDVAPWVGIVLALIAILPQAITAFRGGGDTKKLGRAIEDLRKVQGEHGGALGALRQRVEEGPEKTDPHLAAARVREREHLDRRVAQIEGELKELRGKAERRAEEDARADKELNHQLGRIAGLLEAQNGRR